MSTENLIFGKVQRSVVQDGKQLMEFAVPALNQTSAEGRARFNARVKGLENTKVTETKQIGDGRLPRVKIFQVRVEETESS